MHHIIDLDILEHKSDKSYHVGDLIYLRDLIVIIVDIRTCIDEGRSAKCRPLKFWELDLLNLDNQESTMVDSTEQEVEIDGYRSYLEEQGSRRGYVE